TGRASRDLGISAQLARYAHLRVASYAHIGRRPGHKTVTCGVGRDGCVEIIRRLARVVESALLESVGRGVDTVEKRRGKTKKIDGVGLPEVSPVLSARIHKSRVRCVQYLGRSRLMSVWRDRVRRYRYSGRDETGRCGVARVRRGIFRECRPRWRRRDQEGRSILVTNDGRRQRCIQAGENWN